MKKISARYLHDSKENRTAATQYNLSYITDYTILPSCLCTLKKPRVLHFPMHIQQWKFRSSIWQKINTCPSLTETVTYWVTMSSNHMTVLVSYFARCASTLLVGCQEQLLDN